MRNVCDVGKYQYTRACYTGTGIVYDYGMMADDGGVFLSFCSLSFCIL